MGANIAFGTPELTKEDRPVLQPGEADAAQADADEVQED